ncbi:hypothetical protein SAMN04489742_4899 [Arthrobacter crystallopoietes]|uniref:Oxidoreductase NAD-binding domain-containing protein n=1 Tax=Crystallibacter crystallopoietes TaxID=37928 RepID=A0A1H1I0W5_9MICC|nr:hypothetical protein SAMN04489742_4899 [Arthrobacter crystallopoietes]
MSLELALPTAAHFPMATRRPPGHRPAFRLGAAVQPVLRPAISGGTPSCPARNQRAGGSEEIHSQTRLGTKLTARDHATISKSRTAQRTTSWSQRIASPHPGHGTPTRGRRQEHQARLLRIQPPDNGVHRRGPGDHGDSLAVYPKDERGRADLLTEIKDAPAGTAVYACGPERLLADLQQITMIPWVQGPSPEHFAAATPPPAPRHNGHGYRRAI